jgi:hypothetical protein
MLTFKAKRVTRTYTQKITAPPDLVFPLLCPVREAEWLDGWRYELIYSESGYAEEGCVFKSIEADGAETFWLITKHDRQKDRIEFARLTPGSRVGKLSIQLTDNPDGTTSSTVSYTFTALTEAGNRFIDDYTEDRFKEAMIWWEKSMNHFLKTGEKLKRRKA